VEWVEKGSGPSGGGEKRDREEDREGRDRGRIETRRVADFALFRLFPFVCSLVDKLIATGEDPAPPKYAE
jgi:hypothetical protein